jgi:hypothetical protein
VRVFSGAKVDRPFLVFRHWALYGILAKDSFRLSRRRSTMVLGILGVVLLLVTSILSKRIG